MVNDGLYIDMHGNKRWFKDGLYHRLNGPAMQLAHQSKFWFYQGKITFCYNQKEFERYVRLLPFK